MSHVVLVSDKLSDTGLEVLRAANGIEVVYKPGLSEDELREAVRSGVEGLIIRSGSNVTANVLESASDLRVIGRAGIGVDNIDVPFASKRGIVVMNTPTGNAVTTAEHAITLMLSSARNIARATASMREGKWEKSALGGREICGKTLGIIGIGNIGRIVADRAQGLHMEVIAFDPALTEQAAEEMNVELVDLETLYARADFISIHAPKTPKTQGLISDEAFKAMKDGAFLVNAARGGIVDEQALARALERGKLSGAALDVFEKEPIDPDHPLLKLDNVTLTPHLGASTKEAQVRVAVEIAEQVVGFLSNGVVKNSVNMPSLTPDAAKKTAPFGRLARRLGRIAATCSKSREPEAVFVQCGAEAAEFGARPVSNEALAGVIQGLTGQSCASASAPYEIKDLKIATSESIEPEIYGDASAVTININAKSGSLSLSGTVDREGEPFLVAFDGQRVGLSLREALLAARASDARSAMAALHATDVKGGNGAWVQTGSGGGWLLWSLGAQTADQTAALEAKLSGEDAFSVVHVFDALA